MSIKLFDCTLRDGAHVCAGNFGENHIANIVKGLTDSELDFVELGFFKQVPYDKNVTSYPNLIEAFSFIPEYKHSKTTYALMARADQTDITKLPECNGKIKLIRVAFYYDYLDKAVEFAKEVQTKGYDITLNIINTPGNSIKDLNKVVDYANKINPYVVTIVDTFGVLEQNTLKVIADNYNSNLNPNIGIGLHLHENLSMGYALARWFAENIKNRDIVIDGSLMGIGRAPGNVCTELLADYFNNYLGRNFKLDNILNLIQNDILPIKAKSKWGYVPEYFLSAKHHVHRSYAEYMSENGINLERINNILQKIDLEHAEKFNQKYLEQLISMNGGK